MLGRMALMAGLLVGTLGAAPAPAAANREMQELQRDVAQLQELVKALQASVNERLSAIQGQVQSTSEAAAQAGAAVAKVQQGLERMMHDQEGKLVPPMVTMGTRVDQVTTAVGTMQQAVTDLTALMTRLQSQIGDLQGSVKALQPAAAPPPATDRPPMSSTDLFQAAETDRGSGKLDLALQEYREYLKWYAETPFASDAQYYIGSIHQSQQDYETAVKDFDALLVNYPTAKKVPEALFYKGKSLMLLGRTSEGAEAFQELRRRFPKHDLARQSMTIRSGQ